MVSKKRQHGIYLRHLSTGPEWYIRYRFPQTRTGRLFRERCGPGAQGLEAAKVLLGERLQDIRQGRDPSLRVIAPRLFETVVDEFNEKYVALKSRDPRSYKNKVLMLRRAFAGRTLQSITTRDIEDYIADGRAEGWSGSTGNRLRAVAHKVFKWAIDRGYYGSENPVTKVTKVPENPGRTRFLTGAEAEKLVAKAARHLQPVIITALHTGGRLSEILALRWSAVDLARGVLYFDRGTTKNGRQREIPIDATLDTTLRALRRVRSISGFVFTYRGQRLRNLRTGFEAAVERAGMGTEVTFHVLRHTYASWFVLNGGDVYVLQRLLGHCTISLTARYSHLTRGHLQASTRFFGPPPAEAPGADGGDPQVIPSEGSGGSDGEAEGGTSR